MRTLSLSLSLSILMTAMAHGQSNAASTMSSVNLNNTGTFDNRYEGVKGSPFIMERWYEGILRTNNNEQVKVPQLNFDRHSHSLCFREETEGETSILNKYLVPSFMLINAQGDSLRFYLDRVPGESDQVYLEQIHKGSCLLGLDRAKELVPADFEQVYSQDRRYDEFKDKPVYYLKLETGGQYLTIKKSRKKSAQLFGDFAQEVLKYLKTEDINLATREGVLAMVLYYESLIEE